MKRTVSIAGYGLIIFLAACEPMQGPAGPAGEAGQSCTVTDHEDGTATIACEDGTSTTLGTPAEDLRCSVLNHCNGWSTLSCPDGSSSEWFSGQYCTPVAVGDASYALNRNSNIVGWPSTGDYAAITIEGKYQKIYSGNNILCATDLTNKTTCWDMREDQQSFELSDKINFKKIVVSYRAAICGLSYEGFVKCYSNPYSTESTTLPNETQPEQKILDIAGYDHNTIVALLADGSLAYIGPFPIWQNSELPSGTFQHVYGVVLHACAVTTSNTVKCWGDDSSSTGHNEAPTSIDNAIEITCSSGTSCALLSNGQVRCWGANDEGQASPPNEAFLSISGDYDHFCGLTSDGRVVCWGYNNSGQCDVPEELSVAQ